MLAELTVVDAERLVLDAMAYLRGVMESGDDGRLMGASIALAEARRMLQQVVDMAEKRTDHR